MAWTVALYRPGLEDRRRSGPGMGHRALAGLADLSAAQPSSIVADGRWFRSSGHHSNLLRRD